MKRIPSFAAAMLILLVFVYGATPEVFAGSHPGVLVLPGDTWQALSWRFGVPVDELQALNPHINRQRQPVIGTDLPLPEYSRERAGRLASAAGKGMLQLAAEAGIQAWSLARLNGLDSPYGSPLGRDIFVPGGEKAPRQFPPGFTNLEVSQLVARPGQGLAVRASAEDSVGQVSAALGAQTLEVFRFDHNLVGLLGTGAFFGSGQPELSFRQEGETIWSQPWRFEDLTWDFQQLTLTGAAAAIDQQSIAEERARLFELWSKSSPEPLWTGPFQLPIADYLEYSSAYGARRSYNGGPYSSYHEGVDFSAYGGTAVFAPAAGIVVLAEHLYVRGGAVILDHGLGVYTGFYHMSELTVSGGDWVTAGQQVGKVGSSGLSTGNHLHWDLLVNGTWVDARAWQEQGLGCWILAGVGRMECP